MTIMATSGLLRNRANQLDLPMIISNDDARVAFWRDFMFGLTPAEQIFFHLDVQGDGRGRVELSQPQGTAAWAAVQANPAASGVHQHVQLLLAATADPNRTFHVLPVPVFQVQPAMLAWVTAIVTRQNPTAASMGIALNGYGFFPAEWLGFEVAGRTHRAVRRQVDDACAYATRFIPQPLAGQVVATWNAPWNRPVRVGQIAGDTPQRWVDRESCVTLLHELIHHAIRGVQGHAGQYDDWIERRARNNWNAAHP